VSRKVIVILGMLDGEEKGDASHILAHADKNGTMPHTESFPDRKKV
jgi:hypothetical protein